MISYLKNGCTVTQKSDQDSFIYIIILNYFNKVLFYYFILVISYYYIVIIIFIRRLEVREVLRYEVELEDF